MITLHQLSAAPDAALTAARSLIADATAADGQDPVSDQALLAVTQGQRELTLFAESPVGERIVAAGIVGDGEVDLVVRPEERGRGVGSAALAALIARADEAAASAERPVQLRAWAHGDNPSAEALLLGAQFVPVRSLFRMALDPALLPHTAPEHAATDPALALSRFDAARDAADWVRVNAAAFATHPEQGRITEADFALIREEPWFDPEDLLLLRDSDGSLLGSAWIKTVRDTASGAAESELYAVGVDPASAGRGLGRVLLNAALARMAEHSPRSVTLYVDGDNERAVKLYETAGFTIDSRSRQWARRATDDASARMNA